MSDALSVFTLGVESVCQLQQVPATYDRSQFGNDRIVSTESLVRRPSGLDR